MENVSSWESFGAVKQIAAAGEPPEVNVLAIFPQSLRHFRYTLGSSAALDNLPFNIGAEISLIAVPDRAPDYPARLIDIEDVIGKSFPFCCRIDWIIGEDL